MTMHPLTQFREHKGLTMAALAEAVFVSKATISRIESFEQDPSLDLIRRLVAFAEGALRADDFLGRSTPRATSPEAA